MVDADQKLEDDVLRQMLATKPTPHKPKDDADGKLSGTSKRRASARDGVEKQIP